MSLKTCLFVRDGRQQDSTDIATRTSYNSCVSLFFAILPFQVNVNTVSSQFPSREFFACKPNSSNQSVSTFALSVVACACLQQPKGRHDGDSSVHTSADGCSTNDCVHSRRSHGCRDLLRVQRIMVDAVVDAWILSKPRQIQIRCDTSANVVPCT